jgi:disulfide bond formation protein DsbB
VVVVYFFPALNTLRLARRSRVRRAGNTAGALACCALMAAALYFQYEMQLTPCPLCIFQRVAVVLTGALFLLAAVHAPMGYGARVYGTLIAAAALGGVGVAARHIWIQAQPPGTVAACGADLDYLLDVLPLTEVVTKVLTGSGECGKIDWSFLGLSMPWWVAIALSMLAMVALVINFSRGDVEDGPARMDIRLR